MSKRSAAAAARRQEMEQAFRAVLRRKAITRGDALRSREFVNLLGTIIDQQIRISSTPGAKRCGGSRARVTRRSFSIWPPKRTPSI